MNYYPKDKKGFFTLLGILLAMVIISVLFYFLFNTYYNKPSFDESTQKSIKEQGLDAQSYKTIVDTTREKVKDIENQILDRSKKLENTR